jgi:tripartite ATP-independent transporter DctM subunit
VAAAYALALAAFFYRALSWRQFYDLVLDGARSTAVVGMIIAAALVFNYLVASENIPGIVADSLAGLDIPPLLFLLAINLVFLALGCLFDATTLLLVVVPLFLPSALALGIDPVHFGVLIVVNIMIGLVTPPYGVLLFVINAVTDIPLNEIIREIWPFLWVLLAALGALILFPEIVLFLPRLFGYQ